MRKWVAGAIVAAACLTTAAFALAGGREYMPVRQTPDMKTGFIERVAAEDGRYVLTIDEIKWYEGEEAAKIFRERESDSGLDAPPDGYYIVNDDSALTELPIAADAQVVMQIYDKTGDITEAETAWDEPVSLETFVQQIKADNGLHLDDFPYHLAVKDGQIVKIVQQFIP
ncbi:hypothetical protein ACFSL6_04760 [Paenibacillus thailandensis]|uniref:Uncharacterized protein n=1 Tax=Paenibacillus thailandensis TaxID=393250 RepID=A0ABW5QZI4_9BACL